MAHTRLGDPGHQKFEQLKIHNMTKDTKLIEGIKAKNDLCITCVESKLTKKGFNDKKDKSHVIRPLQIIHSDVCGPMRKFTPLMKRYYVTFIDEYTHYAMVYLIRLKSDVFDCFKDFVAKCEAHFNSKIDLLYCDNEGEYMSNDMISYFSAKGITYHLTIPNSPSNNPIAERFNRTICEKARSLLFTTKLSDTFSIFTH